MNEKVIYSGALSQALKNNYTRAKLSSYSIGTKPLHISRYYTVLSITLHCMDRDCNTQEPGQYLCIAGPLANGKIFKPVMNLKCHEKQKIQIWHLIYILETIIQLTRNVMMTE